MPLSTETYPQLTTRTATTGGEFRFTAARPGEGIPAAGPVGIAALAALLALAGAWLVARRRPA